jgi:hypothetical protein
MYIRPFVFTNFLLLIIQTWLPFELTIWRRQYHEDHEILYCNWIMQNMKLLVEYETIIWWSQEIYMFYSDDW